MDNVTLSEKIIQILITLLLTLLWRSVQGVKEELKRSEDARQFIENLSGQIKQGKGEPLNEPLAKENG